MNNFFLRLSFITLYFLANFSPGFSQNSPNISLQYENVALEKVLVELEEKHQVKFYFQKNWIDDIQVNFTGENISITEFLEEALKNTALQSFQYGPGIFVIINPKEEKVKSVVVVEKENGTGDKTTDVLVEKNYDKNKFYTLSGYVSEESTGEKIIGATVYIDEIEGGTTTNQFGYYAITLPSEAYNTTISFIGYEPVKQVIDLDKDFSMDFELGEKATELEEIVVSAEDVDKNISDISMGKSKVDVKAIKKMPALLGEVDVVRSLLLLPGVSTVGEGATGFNVRGGSVDQNLIMLDDAPIFNSSHLFGMFSVFNPDAVKDVTLYRGGIPAKYGGRLSSILDVKLKEGNNKKFSGSGGIGIVSTRLNFEGPIVKEKTSFAISGRASYSDWAMKMFSDPVINNSSSRFYDANFKINHKFSEKDQIFLSGYLSQDAFKFPADTTYNWGTKTATMRWNHLFSDKLFSNFTAIYSDYNYGIDSPIEGRGFDWKAGIKYQSIKADFSYFAGLKHKFDFGGSAIWYDFSPGDLAPKPDSPINPVNIAPEYAREFAIYLNDEFKITNTISLLYGLRYSYYQSLGPGEVNEYNPNLPRDEQSIIGKTSYGNGEVIKAYGGFEPRAALKIGIDYRSSVKLSYNRMRQYLHLISNTSASTPIDLWQASNKYLKPQIGDQYSLGYFRNFKNNSIETSVEVFYKTSENLVDYKDGATLLLNENIEADLLQGEGKAYGAEFSVKKPYGRLTGWLSYTYSRSFRKIAGETKEETINLGEFYPTNYDKPHDFSAVTSYQLTRRWTFSANFTYSTGRPATYPSSKYLFNNNALADYDSRNQQRIPDYHRLDISLTLDGNHRKNKKWDGSWTFSIYNVYSRDNAFSVFFRARGGFLPQAYKLSVLGAAFPALTYNFKF